MKIFLFKSDPGTQESDITICKKERERMDGSQYMRVKYVSIQSTEKLNENWLEKNKETKPK